ncbi:MAG: hypothetical protein HJJLKODD_00546 [Phycisphaerae bacterium]|nr:hypothetical protein [Phycisphaerae bacterium]
MTISHILISSLPVATSKRLMLCAAFDDAPYNSFGCEAGAETTVSTATINYNNISGIRISGGRPVLCLDDEPTHLMLLTRMLSKAGFFCITATTGLEGREVLKYAQPCLVLLELLMPEMDG